MYGKFIYGNAATIGLACLSDPKCMSFSFERLNNYETLGYLCDDLSMETYDRRTRYYCTVDKGN